MYFLRLDESIAEQVRNICQLCTPSLYLVYGRARSSCAEKKSSLVQLDPDLPSITSGLTLSKWSASSSFAFLFLHRMSSHFHLVDTRLVSCHMSELNIYCCSWHVKSIFFPPLNKGHRYFSLLVWVWLMAMQFKLGLSNSRLSFICIYQRGR